jgi:hypothetical protein
MPVAQAMGFCGGSLAAPIIFGGAVAESGALGKPGTKMLHDALLSDAAIDQRIDLALSAIVIPKPAAASKGTPRRSRTKGQQ